MDADRVRVLVPLDGSPESESILPALMPLFRAAPCRATLLRVVARDEPGGPAEAYLASLRKALLLDGVVADSRVEWGRPADEILYQSRGAWCDLVALTTHGYSGLRRVLMGSVAEAVVRGAQVPVVVNHPWSRVGDWTRIVVALDGSPRAEAVLPDAVRLASLHGATLHLLQVQGPAGVYGPPERAYLEGICDRMSGERILAIPVARQGPPAAEIAGYAAEVGAGLLLLATHGRTGLARAFLGSVTEEVLRSAPCPVYVRRTVPAAAGVTRATA